MSSLLVVLHQSSDYLSLIARRGSGIPAQIAEIQSQLEILNAHHKQSLDQLRTINFLTHQTYEMNQTYLKQIQDTDPTQEKQ
ncbi:MAG: hypothetical protein R3E08_04870 [Thiotrichaceae bacterium]